MRRLFGYEQGLGFKTAVIELTEAQLSEIMYHLPNDSTTKAFLQQAGKNIFNW